jgi:glutaredoxin
MKIEIYSKDHCASCKAAIQLAEGRGLDVTIKKLNEDFNREELLAEFPKARTFPQIKAEGQVIGGFDDFFDFLKATAKVAANKS